MSSKENVDFLDSSGVHLNAAHVASDALDPCGAFKIVCHASDGSVRWEAESPNLVVTVGKNDLLNQYFRGSAYTAGFFVGLKTAGSILATDTMASKTWTEIVAYSNATRPAYTAAVASAGSTNNSASPAVFNINGTATVGGCFITTNNTKGGTTGTLFSVADFAASRSVLSGDTLTVTYSISC
jgi:hypothetical protein